MTEEYCKTTHHNSSEPIRGKAQRTVVFDFRTKQKF